ncbi:MAG: hypothetical protein GWN84_26730, partial [Gammaproteobacteria bacterium]|nr:hypothetical protein [Gammaproteobacteria bacterium]NIR85990.1 hypothetical protein [Gammaproteobacteria bacterium]NIU07232.1 hypothetical protein [Gammaproteobacteria bacterium]NIV54037.1 hypothetical protein [Gammaproteobacteria bacterium]NIX88505.1 hypothetical protein [Gammaproteobacteria bacterium]
TPFLGRRRHLGHAPWPPEAANFPIQGGAADLMNIRTPAIADRLWRDYPSALMVAQVHDAVVIECDERDAEGISLLCRETFEA